MEAPMRLPWVYTCGGPHLVIPERYASDWEGCFVPSHGRVVQAKFRCNPEGPATDYDRACDVGGWLGVIPVGSGEALVLHGDHTPATYYRRSQAHFLLRWHYAYSETELLDHFHDVQARLPVEETVTFRHPGGKLYLMDSVDLPGRWLVEHEEFELPKGHYRVLTSHSETERTYIIVHEFKWV